MAMKIRFDDNHNPESPTFVLSFRDGTLIGKIPATHIKTKDSLPSYASICFDVCKVSCDNNIWEHLNNFMLVWVKEWNKFFEIQVDVKDSANITKKIIGKSLGEAELSQINLYNFEVNTEDDISLPDYVPKVLFNQDDHKLSILHKIFSNAPNYTISHVDTSIAGIQRSFSFDQKDIYSSLKEIEKEIGCLFVIDCFLNDRHELCREISAFDLQSYCFDCGNRGEFLDECEKCGSNNIKNGFGKDTSIFVNTENLSDEITFTTNIGEVKNCFKLFAGDDLMTATVSNCSPSGSPYLWYFSDEVMNTMPQRLSQRISQYNDEINWYNSTYAFNFVGESLEILNRYNFLIDKYKSYNDSYSKIPTQIQKFQNLSMIYYDTIDFKLFLNNTLMPSIPSNDTTAVIEAGKLTEVALSPVAVQDISVCTISTATNAVLAMAKTIVNTGKYRISAKASSFVMDTWEGSFTLTGYADENDTATTQNLRILINDNYAEFVKQKIKKVSAKEKDSIFDASTLFELDDASFKNELQKYSLSKLSYLMDSCQSCIDVLIEQRISDNSSELYESLYVPYRNKIDYIENEIKTRKEEIETISGRYNDGVLVSSGVQNIISNEIDRIQSELNFESYLGEDLWKILCSYVREDVYKNENYISDGLNNSELFNRAIEFIRMAKSDIVKSATMQHSISSSLKNLLIIREFGPLVNMFEVGNWLRIRVDGSVYKLRLIDYEINFDDLSNIAVTFSDVYLDDNGIYDVKSILDKTVSMSTSFQHISKQADVGEKSGELLSGWVNNGMDMTNLKIVSNPDNQNITWDSHGVLCREYDPMLDEYDKKQLKIINKGLYLTDDNWLTSKAGIGNFIFYNPLTRRYEESYGVIADKLVGNLILSEKVGIYNKSNSLTVDENGVTITSDNTLPGENKTVFLIQKKETSPDNQEVLSPLLALDKTGGLVLDGSMKINSKVGSKDFNGYIDDVSNKFSEVQVNSDGIMATVQHVKESMDSSIDSVNKSINTITNQINAKVSPEDLTIEVKKQIENGVTNVKTSTGFTFNQDGLTVSKSGKEMTTQITENGMTVNKDSEPVLTANNIGVDAVNLHASTYLIVGNRSRFENYGNDQTGCFWIGG